MRLKKNIATSEEGFIFNPSTGDSFSANEIGSEIIAMLREERPLSEIIDTLCSKYDVDESQCERDLDDYIDQLKEFNIVTAGKS